MSSTSASDGASARSRRQFLKGTLGTSALLLVAACTGTSQGASPTAAPTAGSAGAAKPSGSPAAAGTSPATASSPAAQAAPGQPGPRKALKIGIVQTMANAPLVIAQQRGYFTQEGLDVELTPFGSGAEIVAPLGQGQIDAGNSITPSAGLMNAILRNVRVKVVASNGTIKPNHNVGQVMVRKDLQPGSEMVDLTKLNKPIRGAALAEGLVPHAVLLMQAEKAGLKQSDMSVSFMGFPDMNAAFNSKNIDIAASGEPLISIGVQQGVAVRWKQMAELYPDLPYSNLLYGPNLLDKDKDAGTRLLRGYLRGARDFEDAFSKNKDKDALIQQIAGPLNQQPAIFQAVQDGGGLVYIDPNGTQSFEPLRPFVDFWVANKVIATPVDVATIVDMSYAEAAVQQLGRYQ